MADDLQDDWWNSDDNVEESTKLLKDKKEANKDGDETNNDNEENQIDKKRKQDVVDENENLKKKYRKRPKKKRITEVTLSERGASRDDLRSSIDDFYKGKLSQVEKEAIELADEHFGPTNIDLSHTVTSFLKEALPKWQKISSSYGQKMSPLVILLSSNANRSLELNRDASSFKGEKCKTAKLFARHLKPKAQTKFLKSNVVHFAIGTPARVASLISEGSLSLVHTRFVMLDWNWRDVKMKRMVDIPDIQKSLMNLLKDHVIPACKSHHAKIGMY